MTTLITTKQPQNNWVVTIVISLVITLRNSVPSYNSQGFQLMGGQGGGTQYYGGHSPPCEVSPPLLVPPSLDLVPPLEEFFPASRAIYMLTIV